MSERVLTFPVENFRKLPNPYQQKDTEKKGDEAYPQMYFAICDVKEIPEDIPMATNPRNQSMNNGVAKKIKASLLNTSELNFYLLNRGMVISADSVHYDNNSGKLSITFSDEEVHGDVDGGHTYKAILEKRKELEPGQQFVKLEILTGVEDIFQALAAARNTSTQVQDKSIAELEHRFDLIKDIIKNEPFNNNVYFRENDKGDIDVADIISMLTLFNLEKYPDINSFPVIAYSGRKKCIDYYIEAHKKSEENPVANPYYRMRNIMIDIFKLYDMLESNIGAYYKQKNASGRYGSVKGVSVPKGDATFKSKYYKTEMDYLSPTGFLYPILGAFRALVKDDGVEYSWKCDPFKIMEKVGPELVETTVERSRTLGNNAQAVGKDVGNWKTLYMTIALEMLSIN